MRKILHFITTLLCFAVVSSVSGQVTLNLTQTATPTTVQSGETFQYSFSYSIASTSIGGSNVKITDTLPAGIAYEGAVFNSSHINNVTTTTLDNGRVRVLVTFRSPIAAGSTGQVALTCKYLGGTTPNNTQTTNYGYINADNPTTATRNKMSGGATVTATATMPFYIDKDVYAYNAEYQRVTWRVRVRSTRNCNNGLGALNLTNAILSDSLIAGSTFHSITSSLSSNSWSYAVDTLNRVNITLPTLNAVTWCNSDWLFFITATYPLNTFAGGTTVNNRAILRGTPIGGAIVTLSDTANQTLLTATHGSHCAGGMSLSLKGVENTDNYVYSNYENEGNVDLVNYAITTTIPTSVNPTFIKNTGSASSGFSLQYRTNTDTTWQIIGQYAPNSTENVALPTLSGSYVTAIRKIYDTLIPSAYAQLRIQFTVLTHDRAGNIVVGVERPQQQYPCMNDYTCMTFVSTLSYTFRGTVYSDACSITKMPYKAGAAVAYNRTTVTSSSPYTPGSTVKFFLEFMSVGERDFKNVTINSTLNNSLEYISWSPKSQNGSAWNPSPAFTRNGQVMTWFFDSTNTANTWPRNGEGYGVEVVARIKPYTAPGNIAHSYTATAANYAVEWSGEGAVVTNSAVIALDAVKWSRGSLDPTYVKYPDVATATTTRAGRSDYRLAIKNLSNITMNNFEVVEILPYVGDKGVTTTGARGSQWRPSLVGPIEVPQGVTVYYSIAKNPCRPQMDVSGPSGCTTANWTTTPPVDITLVQSLRFVFNNLPLNPLDSLVLSWPMRAPADAPIGSEVAWSSFGYTGNRSDNNETLLPSEPLKVGIKLSQPPANSSYVGDFIWIDKNNNGIQDSTEHGLNGVKAMLYQDNGTPALDIYGREIPFTRSANNSAGYSGYYTFPMVPIGNYYVEFSDMPSGLSIAQRVTGNAGLNNSDVNTNARTDVFSIASGQSNLDLDLGLQCTPPSVSATITPPTCGGAAYNVNGKITLSGFDTLLRADWVQGSYYTKNGLVGYTYAAAIPANGIIASTLPNPSVPTNYTVRIFAANGCYQDITLTLNPRPMMTLTSQPTGIIECVGGNLTMSITTSGAATYRWQTSTNGTSGWSNVSSATNSTFTVPSTTAGLRYYRAIATSTGVSECGILTSSNATGDIKADPTVSATASTNAVCVGGISTLTATNMTGGLPTSTCSLQWQISTNGTTWTNIDGATAATYVTPALAATRHYRVVRTCTGLACDVATSASVTITVVADPTVTAQPANITQCAGGTTPLSITATGGTPALIYQWQSSLNGTFWSNIAGATSNTYTPWSGRIGASRYRVVVRAVGSGCDTAISSAGIVTINPDLLIVSNPENIEEYIGENQALAVVATGGTGTRTYQWQRSIDGRTWVNISGANDTTYIPSSAVAGVSYYRATVTASGNGCDATTSRAAKVTVLGSEDTSSYNGEYELRFNTLSIDCVTKRAYIALQIKATHDSTRFFMGNSNLRFSYSLNELQNFVPILQTNASRWTTAWDMNYMGQTFTRTSMPNNREMMTVSTNYIAENETAKMVGNKWLTLNIFQMEVANLEVPFTFTWQDTTGETPTIVNELRFTREPSFSYESKPAIAKGMENTVSYPMERMSRFRNCPSNVEIATTAYNAVATWTPPVVTDNCGTTYRYTNYNPGATFGIGSTTILYTSLQPNTQFRDTCKFDVIVTRLINPCDTERIAPVFANCPKDTTLRLTTAWATNYTWIPPSVTDNCSTPAVQSTYSPGAQFGLGTWTVTYTATDRKNNKATCNFNVTVLRANPCDVDTIKPVFSTCPSNISVSAGAGTTAVATWTTPTATDNCATPRLFSNYNSGHRFGLGTSTVQYAALDARNNKATCTFTVTVTRTPPTSDIELTAVANKIIARNGDDIVYTITVKNKGTLPTYNVQVAAPLTNNGLTFKSNTATKGYYNRFANIWQIGTLNVNETVVLTVVTNIASNTVQTARFFQVITQTPLDTDSRPNNNTTGEPTEDDEARVVFQLDDTPATFSVNGKNNTVVSNFYETSLKLLNVQQAYPNPVEDMLNIQLESNYEGESEWRLYDAQGNLIITEKRTLSKQNNTIYFDLTQLPSGVYSLMPITPNKQLKPIKVIKM